MMKRSMVMVLKMGSMKLLRLVGRLTKITSEIGAFMARAEFTVASDQLIPILCIEERALPAYSQAHLRAGSEGR